MTKNNIFLLCIIIVTCMGTSTFHGMQSLQKHCAVVLGRQTIGRRIVPPLLMRHNRFYADKLGHGDFHPFNVPPDVLQFFIGERDKARWHLKEANDPLRYTGEDWIAIREKIARYQKIKTILDLQIADDVAAGTASVLQEQCSAIGRTVEELKKKLASAENSMAIHKAKCDGRRKYVEAYDAILQKIQRKPC